MRTALAALLSLLAIPAAAQEPVESGPGVTVTDGGSRIIYGPEYFTPYNVVTASDQVERIPGMQEVLEADGEDERGFGNAGAQILINGKRLSGKSNDAGSALERIQARQVLRIEVIRGTVAGLDVRSQGRVVNIVLDGALVTGVGSWQANVEDYSDSAWGGGGEVSYNGDIGALNYLVSANVDSRKNLEYRSDIFLSPAYLAYERQVEASGERTEEYALTANTSYAFANGDLLTLVAQDGPFERYDIDYSEEWRQDPDAELFVEVRPVANLTLLLSIEQTLRAESVRERLQYVDQRSLGQLQRLELRNAQPGREITFSVRGVY